MAMNLASKYSNKVDERFSRESQALMGTNKDYEFTGVKTVVVYQIDTVPMQDYTRSGANRYGQPSELGNTIQSLTLTRDRSFTFTIDKGNKTQSMMVMDAGKSLSRQMREVVIPEFDTYVFNTQAEAAVDNNAFTTAAVSSATAYAAFLKGSEILGNKNVPDVGRIAFCSYGFANLLMLDPAFMKYSDKSQDMVIKGILGEVDGTKIVKVPASRLPYGCSFMIVHPSATVAPKQLEEYKTHENPPGISGWLVEGRMIYDAFVLNGKKDAIYLALSEGVLGDLNVRVGTTAHDGADLNGKLIVEDPDRMKIGTLKIKAGTTLPAYGDADTGYTAVAAGDTISADSIVALVVDGKIIAAKLLDV